MTAEQFKQDILPWSRKLYPMVKRLLKNEVDVQDALQDILIKLWNKRENIQQYEKPEAYVLTMCRNHCLDVLKKKRDQLVDAAEDYRLMNLPQQGVSHEAREKLAIVHQVIEQLPNKYREVIQYREIDGLGFDEIKQMTGFEVPHLRVILSRARVMIKEEIRKIYDYEQRTSRQAVGKVL